MAVRAISLTDPLIEASPRLASDVPKSAPPPGQNPRSVAWNKINLYIQPLPFNV